MKVWFLTLWNNSESFSEKEITDFINQNDNISAKLLLKPLKSKKVKHKIKTKLIPLATKLKADKDYEIELQQAIKKIKQPKEWLNKYFDIVKELFEEFDINSKRNIAQFATLYEIIVCFV